MGLFGGFRAKFTKDTTAKSVSRNAKRSEVVCVGYKAYSEFQDTPNNYTPPQGLPAIRNPLPAIKNVPPRPESTKNDNGFSYAGPSTSTPIIETQIITNPNAKKSTKKKTPLPPTRTSTTTLSTTAAKPQSPRQETINPSEKIRKPETHVIRTDEVQDNTSKNLLNSSTIERTKNDKAEYTLESTYVTGKTSSFNPTSTISSSSNNHTGVISNGTRVKEEPKSILKSRSPVEKHQETKEDRIIVTNDYLDSGSEDEDHGEILLNIASKNSKQNYKTETEDYMTRTQVSTYVSTTAEISNGTDSTSETTNTSSNSYFDGGYSYSQQQARSIGGTSSHAASIFFGGDEEPAVRRPRRVNLGKSTEDEEEDC